MKNFGVPKHRGTQKKHGLGWQFRRFGLHYWGWDMLSLKVYNRQGQEAGQVEVNPSDFGGRVNRQLLHDAVIQYLANQRTGTHSTLRRGEVAGSTKKLFKQKGTGNARVGNKRTNKRRGGGTAKGPKPRDYSYYMPRKAQRAAIRMAILSKFQDNQAIIIEDLVIQAPKTSEVRGVLTSLKLLGAKESAQTEGFDPNLKGVSCLIGVAKGETDEAKANHKNIYLSARNLPTVRVAPADELNVYQILRQKRLVLTRSALDVITAKARREQTAAGKGE